jgi:hypothetical protein
LQFTVDRWRFHRSLRSLRNGASRSRVVKLEVPPIKIGGMVGWSSRQKGKQGRHRTVSGNGSHSPPPLFPFFTPNACTIPPPTIGGGGTSSPPKSSKNRAHSLDAYVYFSPHVFYNLQLLYRNLQLLYRKMSFLYI